MLLDPPAVLRAEHAIEMPRKKLLAEGAPTEGPGWPHGGTSGSVPPPCDLAAAVPMVDLREARAVYSPTARAVRIAFMDSGLRDTSVLITGASGGIGEVTARAFAAEGARPLLHYHRQTAAAERLATELGAPALQADIQDADSVQRLFSEAVAVEPRLDTLVVNAGVWAEEPTPLHRMSLEQWQTTMAVNLTGAFLCCRAFLRHLERVPRESASIVLVASTAGLFGEHGHADYAASKSALAYGLTLSLKNEIVELAPRGRVNCVCPGWVATPMAEGALAVPGTVERVTATMALRKIATPEDVARAIVFLASEPLSGHITGCRLTIAGGMEGRLIHPPTVD